MYSDRTPRVMSARAKCLSSTLSTLGSYSVSMFALHQFFALYTDRSPPEEHVLREG